MGAKQNTTKATTIRKLLKQAGLYQTEAAELLGIADRSMRRYVRQGGHAPRVVEYALRWVIANGSAGSK